MNLKSILKLLKLNESTISMILGALVIIVVGMLVVNYFRSNEPGTTFPEGVSTEEKISLPATHTVQEGETLWSISEKYYQSGYNWSDIAEANDLTRADVIAEGQQLTIPNVEPKSAEEPEPTEATIAQTPEPTLSPVPTNTPTPISTPTPTPSEKTEVASPENLTNQISGDKYTVVRGDNLWNIAVRAYGDGFKWVEISQANDLANPDLIHAGNVFVIPR